MVLSEPVPGCAAPDFLYCCLLTDKHSTRPGGSDMVIPGQMEQPMDQRAGELFTGRDAEASCLPLYVGKAQVELAE